MSVAFDPYYKWLAIPPEQQPPDRYRLLGLQPFESDPDVIMVAADRQMWHLRNCAQGSNVELSQRLLNEIAAARIALLNPATKAAYDQLLATQLRSLGRPAPQPPPLVMSRAGGVPPAPVPIPGQLQANAQAPQAFHPESDSISQQQRRAHAGWSNQLRLVAAMLGLAGFLVLVFMLLGRGKDPNENVPAAKESPSLGSAPVPGKSLPLNNPARPVERQPAKNVPVQNEKPATNDEPIEVATQNVSIEPSPAQPVEPTADKTTPKQEPDQPAEKPAEAAKAATAGPKAGPLTFHIAPHAKSVDLLKQLSSDKLAHTNSRLDDEGLVVSRGGSIGIPYNLPETYVLKATVQQVGQDRLANVYLQVVVGGYQTLVGMEATRDRKKYVWGLHLKDTFFMDNALAVEGPFFEPGVANTVFIFVRKDGIRVVGNGHLVHDWSGDVAGLGDFRKPGIRYVHIDYGYYDYRLRELMLYEPGAVVESTKLADGAAPQGPGNGNAPAGKRKVPNEKQRVSAEEEIKKLFADEFKKARTSADKFALAQELYNASLKSHEDAIACYVLIVEAKDLAAEAGKVDAAMQMVDTLEQHYELDALPMRLATLSVLGKSNQTQSVHLPVTVHAMRMIDLAIAGFRFDEANGLVEVAQASARRTKDPALVKQVAAVSKRLTQLEVVYRAAQGAFETLQKNPADPAANLAAGRYVCFHMNDWPRGLALLAKSGDSGLKLVVEQEQAEPKSSEMIEKLGDAWWEIADQSADHIAKAACRARAAHWYRQALPELKGLSKVKVEKRLEELQEPAQ